MRIGQGIDVHRLAEGESLILGGVNIPSDLGLVAHSDGDVLLHAVMDAMLGAISSGDIGAHFPDSDPKYKNADSRQLTKYVRDLVTQKGYGIVNLDCTLMAETPKLAPHIDDMRQEISRLLDVAKDQVSVKATTCEGLGFVGYKQGISAKVVVLLN